MISRRSAILGVLGAAFARESGSRGAARLRLPPARDRAAGSARRRRGPCSRARAPRASSSERCCTVTLASVAFSVQYACFTAATVCTTDSRKRSSELCWFRFAMMYCCRAASIVAILAAAAARTRPGSPTAGSGSKLLIGLLRRRPRRCPTRRSTCPQPHGSRCRTPVDENQSSTSTPRSPSRKFDGGVDVARAAERRREHRRERACGSRRRAPPRPRFRAGRSRGRDCSRPRGERPRRASAAASRRLRVLRRRRLRVCADAARRDQSADAIAAPIENRACS